MSRCLCLTLLVLVAATVRVEAAPPAADGVVGTWVLRKTPDADPTLVADVRADGTIIVSKTADILSCPSVAKPPCNGSWRKVGGAYRIEWPEYEGNCSTTMKIAGLNKPEVEQKGTLRCWHVRGRGQLVDDQLRIRLSFGSSVVEWRLSRRVEAR